MKKLSYLEFQEELAKAEKAFVEASTVSELKRASKAHDKLLAVKAKSYPNFESNLKKEKIEIILNKLRSDDLTSEEAERLAAEYFVLKTSL